MWLVILNFPEAAETHSNCVKQQQVLKCVPAGLILREKDTVTNSICQVIQQLFHQSYLVPEGIPLGTSQLVTEADMWKPFKHSKRGYKGHLKQEEKMVKDS